MMQSEREDLAEKDVLFDISPLTYEINGRLMNINTQYPNSYRGIIKVLEIALGFLGLILTCESQPVNDERGVAMFFATAGIIISFALLISYILMLNFRCPSTPWLIVECFLYVILIGGLLIGAILMAIFCAAHWSNINPAWEMMPALASGTLFVTAIVYIADLSMNLWNWKRWSWTPTEELGNNQQNSVLPQ